MKQFIVISLALILIFAMASCQKEDETINQSVPSTQVDMGTPDPGDSGDSLIMNTKAANNTWIMNAGSANDIPSQMFSVDYKYKSSYQHKKMNYTSSGFGKCSWTSYVITAACIIKGNCNYCSYPVNDSKVDQVMNTCLQYAGSYSNAAAITTIKWYCQDKDYSTLSCRQKSTSNSSSGRFEAIRWMLDHLLAKHSPFLVISTSGGQGHYLIVHAIDWKRGGTGSTVYYTDCLNIASGANTSYSSNIKTMSLSSFLDKMVTAPTMYNMLFLWSNTY